MTVLTNSNGITIDSNLGSIVLEEYPFSDPRSHDPLTFTFTAPSKDFQYWVRIEPLTGSYQDFFPKLDAFGQDTNLSGFVSGGGFFDQIATFTVSVAPDKIVEGDETFKIVVYSGPADPALGVAPVAEATFTIADDDEPGFAQHLIGTDGQDKLVGNSKSDILKGFGGKDTLLGLGGSDRLIGGAGDDLMFGGPGNDVYVVDSKGDRVFETDTSKSTADTGGSDTVLSSVTYSVADTIQGRQFIEKLTLTGTANISGTGNSLANTLIGNDGNNVLRGLAGEDTITAGAGNDKLYGGQGKDTLTGGSGKDAFVFDTAPDARDLITDFSRAKGDVLQLSKTVFAGFAHTGMLYAGEFWASADASQAHDGDDRMIYNTSTGVLYYDADGLGGTAAVAIAQLGATVHPNLAYSDIQIIA